MPSTQINRPFRVKTTLGDDALLVDRISGVERMSEPFLFTYRLLSENANIDLKGLLNQPAVLSIVLSDNSERHIHGNIRSMKLLELGVDGMAAYEAEVVPWFWFMTQFATCRIYQNKTVPQIVEKVFQDRGFQDFELQLTGSYPTREYCVQYRETDFNFVSRLLEEEGIFYFFKQSEAKHIMVLADAPSAIASCPNQAAARFLPAAGGVQEQDTVTTLEAQAQVQPGTTALTDYNFKTPNTSLYATLSGDQQGEIYDYPGKHQTKTEGDRYSRIRLEELEAGIITARGESNCMGFECGYKFTLSDHYRDSANMDYTLLGLDHHGRNASYRAGDPDPFEYHNRFEAMPNSVPFRPARRARKPVIDGTQTAVVVGKSGEEIWTDQFGRVKVQFYWDREGVLDENSSCWIRVAHGWAGKQWGYITLPRIGQEVVVDFLEGDPDRPLITGSVYNAEQMPPYTLPDQQNKSTWKSMSTKGGGGFNEIRLEDTKGSEQIFVHGEKNVDIRIKNDEYKNIDNNLNLIINKDRYEHIKNDHHETTDNDQFIKAGRDHHFTVGGKQAIKVTGTRTLQVTGDVTEVFKSNHSEDVTMAYYLKAGMTIVIESTAGITLKCGSNSVVVDPTGVTVTGSLVTVTGQLTKINSGPGSPPGVGTAGQPVSPTAPEDATEADKADPGEMAHIKAEQEQAGKGKYGTISPASHTPSTVAAAAAAQQATDPKAPPKTWIEIELVNKDGDPVPGEKYSIKLPDGSVAEGTLDDHGKARVDGIDPGSCQVTFPNMDQTVWEPKS